MTGYQIIGLTMGEIPFIHNNTVYTDWLEVEKEIRKLSLFHHSEKEIGEVEAGITSGRFWVEDTFYKVHTVEIILPKGFYKDVQNFNPSAGEW